MSGILSLEFQRAFRNPRFIIVFLLALASFLVGWSRLGTPGTPYSLADSPLNAYNLWLMLPDFGYYVYLAPLLAALPYADSLLTDRKQGFLRHVSLRCSYRRYLSAKALANAAAGAAAVALPLLLLLCVTLLVAPAQVSGTQYFSRVYNATQPVDALGFLYNSQPLLYAFYIIFLGALFGAVYASLGLAVSTLFSNPYLVLAAPFAFFNVASYLTVSSIHLAVLGQPAAALQPYTFPSSTTLQIAGQHLALILFAVACLSIFGRKTRLLGEAKG